MRKLYVLSAPLDGKPRRLIGELFEENGEYSFNYKLGSGALPEWFLLIKEFPDIHKPYENDDIRKLLNRIIPSENDLYIKDALEAASLEKYDEWELLKYCGQHSARNDVYFLKNYRKR